MRKYMLLSVLLPCLLFSENETKISSKNASYDGENLRFDGDVLFEHDLGKMIAMKAFCNKKSNIEGELLQINLEDHVRLIFANGGELFCERAHFDLVSQRAELQPKEGEKILYTHPTRDCNAPLSILCENVELLLGKKLTEGKQQYFVETIRATATEHSLCSLHQGENRIETPLIEWQLLKDEVYLTEPKGTFVISLAEKNAKSSLVFNCLNMVWEKQRNRLVLLENVLINAPEMGEISSKTAYVRFSEGDLSAQSFSAEGDVRLSSTANEAQRCGLSEKLSYDFFTKIALLSTEKGKRVLLWDERKGMTISANQIEMKRGSSLQDYSFKGIGNVRFGFTSTEHSILKKLFPFYNPEEANE